MPLLTRVFAVNALALVAAAVALVATPATVSFPVALTEALVLIAGLGALLAFNFVVLRRVFRPLGRLTGFMRDVDPLRPGRRAPGGPADPEVAELTEAFNEMIERLERERRDSARRALAAQEGERRRIARDLHDEVGQTLTAAVLTIEHAASRPGAAAAELAEAREEVRAALEDVREIARGLRPEALDDLGLGAALRSLVVDFERRTRTRVVRETELAGRLSSEEELVVYRVAQEALTNAARHAEAREVRVALRPDGAGRTVLTVEDDGRGFRPGEPRDGSGIRGMRERALLAGALLRIDSAPGRGTSVRLETGGGAEG